MRVKTITYNEFFKNVDKVYRYESAALIVDSIRLYEDVIHTRWTVVNTNDNYWFLVNLLNIVLKEHDFYKKISKEGKSLSLDYLKCVISEFQDAIYKEFTTIKAINSVHVVRDTLRMTHTMLLAIRKLDNKGQK